MIPTHKLVDEKVKDIRVIKLNSLSQYNIMEPHRHEYVELFFFLKGRGTHEIDFVTFDVEPLSIHIISSGRVHRLKRELNSQGYVVLFHPSIFAADSPITEFLFDIDCRDVNEHAPIYTFTPDVQAHISDAVQSLWDYYQSDNPYKHHFILNKLSLVCLHCAAYSDPNMGDTSIDHQHYVLFRKQLHKQFKESRKVTDYSEQLGITSRKLNEIVSARTGISVSQLIQKQVVLEAKRLLNTGLTTKEVAYELEFDDPAHFSKYFKNQTGLSPSEFQKIHF